MGFPQLKKSVNRLLKEVSGGRVKLPENTTEATIDKDLAAIRKTLGIEDDEAEPIKPPPTSDTKAMERAEMMASKFHSAADATAEISATLRTLGNVARDLGKNGCTKQDADRLYSQMLEQRDKLKPLHATINSES